ncbi:concanavalin A-like lectin/glucanase domain-containing protein [Amylostereum chailletii]|nr:concanavalin A-like lectin/glucanase domain-containing protein [Amylostereum chailletii]
MRLSSALLTLSLAQPFVAEASSTHSSFRRVTDRFHHIALKRSSGLAQDIRLALKGLIPEEPSQRQQPVRRSESGKAYCVSTKSSKNSPTNSSGTDSSPSSSTSTHKATGTSTSGAASATSTATNNSSDFTLVQDYSGSDFFTGWDFFTGSDPTNGIVEYVDQSTGESANLTSIENGNAIMRVETTEQVSGNRQSIRITTKYTFNGALVIMDSTHMPTGCGTWPAFWTNGPNWPTTGEIDIVEGVNTYIANQATIHTASGCSLSTSNLLSLDLSGTLTGGTNCAALETNNEGCGIRDSNTKSFGSGFNDIGGGVYAMLWDDDGIRIHFFPRSSIPSDIDAGVPQPDTWGAPTAFWPASSCNPSNFFKDHSAIFDTTLCGDWASGVWSSTGVPGQDTSCAASTGVSTCEEYVRNNGNAFSEAYWSVKSVKIYQAK